MAKPDKILIPHDDYRFERVGKLSDGHQFIAGVAGAFPDEYIRAANETWRDIKQWIAVLHLFDSDGNHIKTVSELVALNRDIHKLSQSDQVLEDLLQANGVMDIEYGDIEVKLFSVTVNGIRHHLTYNSEPNSDDDPADVYEYVAFSTFDVAFNPPWDSGRYDT
jgi:hypothetical protein